MGSIKDTLDAHGKAELLAFIEHYRLGHVSLIVPLTLPTQHPVPD